MRYRNATNALLTSLLAVGIAGAATAGEGEAKEKGEAEKPYPKFEKVDQDGNGMVSWEEAKKAGVPKEAFDDVDYDGNELVSRYVYKSKINEPS